jgi:hypothetical protein
MRGHLRQRAAGTWELRAYAGIDPVTKRDKYVTRTFRGGKREAEDALTRLVLEISGGGHAAQCRPPRSMSTKATRSLSIVS